MKTLTQKIQKYLLHEYIPVMETLFETGFSTSCVAQRSLYVMLRGNEETRNYVNQVRTVLIFLSVNLSMYFKTS